MENMQRNLYLSRKETLFKTLLTFHVINHIQPYGSQYYRHVALSIKLMKKKNIYLLFIPIYLFIDFLNQHYFA